MRDRVREINEEATAETTYLQLMSIFKPRRILSLQRQTSNAILSRHMTKNELRLNSHDHLFIKRRAIKTYLIHNNYFHYQRSFSFVLSDSFFALLRNNLLHDRYRKSSRSSWVIIWLNVWGNVSCLHTAPYDLTHTLPNSKIMWASRH